MAINIQNMCSNGGQTGGQTGGGGAVNAVNGVAPGADGNVRLTADNVGAALQALNVQSVTKQYRRFIAHDGNENVTPQNYLWGRGKGSFFLRADDGVHFVACVDLMSSIAARVYAHLPNITAADGDVIDGGVYIADTKLVAFESTEDIQQLIFKIGGSPIVTEQALLTRLSDYVTNAAIKSLSDQTLWKDLTDEWSAYRDDNDNVAFVAAARSFVKEQADGRYCFTSEDGDVVHARIVTAGTGNTTVKYRIIWFAPHGATDRLSFEYWQNDNRLIGTSTGDGILRLEMLGKQVVFKDELSAALAGIPSLQSVENAIRMEVRDVTSTYDQLSVVRTRLQKFANMKHTIRVEIENARMLLDEEDVILQLWVCSRKHGTAHHWWHPSQPGSPTRTSKIGYAIIAGELIYKNIPLKTARFPAVPAWMPNNGYVLTEIPVTAQDLRNGYVDIDASTYFLPFVKPRGTTWKYKEVVMMFTQPKTETDKRYSVPVTWKVAVMRNGSYHQIGGAENVAKIGFRRHYASGDLIEGTSRTKKLKNLHISIK